MIDINKINFSKGDGLVPVIVQDSDTHKVLMLGYTNEESLQKTIETGLMTFYSRSKQRLWTKGEESGHFLKIISLSLDCDQDTILAKVNPVGPVCHTGTDTCWGEVNQETSYHTSRRDHRAKEKRIQCHQLVCGFSFCKRHQ
jgi:phosphoribosyl-AMP cyclohydrolase / phosphoribosyl-ATP pyrophosphohydrolase